MIEKIIEEYEGELKLLMFNTHDKYIVTSHFLEYQKFIRNELKYKDFKNNYKEMWSMYYSYIKNERKKIPLL